MAEHNSQSYIPEVRVLCGLPACGKSTDAVAWVRKHPDRRVRINYDDLRQEMFPGKAWNRTDENAMQAKAVEQFENAMRLGMSVVIDNTNLSPKVRQQWVARALAHNIEASVEEIGSHLHIWDLIDRDLKRPVPVGRAVIERMALFNGFIDWSDKAIYPCEGFVICDLDGTLCDISHRRHYVARTPDPLTGVPAKPDWKSFFANVSKDSLNAPVADLLDMFGREGYHILLVSGRPITPCGLPTQEWLIKHEIRYDHLFMRASGDSRSDVIVKSEILDLLPKDRIDYVLDDRPSVIKDVWQKNELFTLTVGNLGDF